MPPNHYKNLQGEPNERSSLLMKPSPNSTDRPSSQNLPDLESELNVLLEKVDPSDFTVDVPMNIYTKDQKLTDIDFYSYWNKQRVSRTRRSILCVIISLLALLGALLFIRLSNSRIHQHEHPVNPTQVQPLSLLDPVHDLSLADFSRPSGTRPSLALNPPDNVEEEGKRSRPFPTNSWYQNLLMPDDEPSELNRANSIPYVVDASGPIPGIRVHPNHVDSGATIVQQYVQEKHGLTLGASFSTWSSTQHAESPLTHRYTVNRTTPLGLTLQWNTFPMQSTIMKGMPYVTMRYSASSMQVDNGESIVPTIASEIALKSMPIVDGNVTFNCEEGKLNQIEVKREVEVLFELSDFTWLLFVSEPVIMTCQTEESGMTRFAITRRTNEPEEDDQPFYVRVALYKFCSTGLNPIYCHQEQMHPTALLVGQGDYGSILRNHAHLIPGPGASVSYKIHEKDSELVDERGMTLIFDWDVQRISSGNNNISDSSMDLIAFALPHHFDMFGDQYISPSNDLYCAASLTGPACLVKGSIWALPEKIPEVSFRAPRPPQPWAIGMLADSLREDIKFRLPGFFQRGAGDTYFSGKMLARLGRILLIAEEIRDICEPALDRNVSQQVDPYREACSTVSLPSAESFQDAIDGLKKSVQVWIDGSAEAPFVYDSAWGGVVSCGCLFNGKKCSNSFPDCPAFSDPGLNFGNAFYNDNHFHYGYHIFSAAVVAHFDADWGRTFFERVLLLIRNIANPSEDDQYFTTWRHKDWYQGHSWASGVAGPPYRNGKNQESSSEAIAAYEAVALYGSVMMSAWREVGSVKNVAVAKEITDVGLLMTATELRSAKRYWHVLHETDESSVKIYPSEYSPYVIGMLWQSMAQFQTWFGSAGYLAYGIQILPLTPISEFRDDLQWAKSMYSDFAASCERDRSCEETGWSIQQLAILATVGHAEEAAEKARSLPKRIFEEAGANGHSKTNTLWYISTRPSAEPPHSTSATKHQDINPLLEDSKLSDCYRPDSCTEYVLDTIAGIYSCRQRMKWLIQYRNVSQKDACAEVAATQFPKECGACNPYDTDTQKEEAGPPKCPACTQEQCNSDLNRCPIYERTYVCTEGLNLGGCARLPWDLPNQEQCSSCCELTGCPSKDMSADSRTWGATGHLEDCPPCPRAVCKSHRNLCPANQGAPFLCVDGPSAGGCSPKPWSVHGFDCSECCKLLEGCPD